MKKIILSFFINLLIISFAFAEEMKSADNVIGVKIDKEIYNWHDAINATINIYNPFENDMEVVFSGSCPINAKIINKDISYDVNEGFCVNESTKYTIEPGDFRFFKYTMQLEEVAGINSGDYEFWIYLKPAIYTDGARYRYETYAISQTFNFAGNIDMKIDLEKQEPIFESNEMIKGIFTIQNNGERIYKTYTDSCYPLVKIYDYYSKQLVFEKIFTSCNQNDIEIKTIENYTSNSIILYDPTLDSELPKGTYTLTLTLNDNKYSPKTNFSHQFQILPKETTFTDLNDHWSKNYVTELYKKGFINGYPDNSFKPDKEVTKAEFIKIALNATKKRILDSNEINIATFTDVSQNDWYYNYIETAAHLGVISSDETKVYFPNKNITRKEAAYIIFKCLTSEKNGNLFLNIFSDIEEIDVKYVMTLYNLGIINGYSGTTNFAPLDPLSRGAAAKIALLANSYLENIEKVDNKNIALRYYFYPTDLRPKEEYDLILCESGQSAYFHFDPMSPDGGQFYKVLLTKEQIDENLLKPFYEDSFFAKSGIYNNCTENCEENIEEGLIYYYSNLKSQMIGNNVKTINEFINITGDLRNYFETLGDKENLWQTAANKTENKYFGENFCL